MDIELQKQTEGFHPPQEDPIWIVILIFLSCITYPPYAETFEQYWIIEEPGTR